MALDNRRGVHIWLCCNQRNGAKIHSIEMRMSHAVTLQVQLCFGLSRTHTHMRRNWCTYMKMSLLRAISGFWCSLAWLGFAWHTQWRCVHVVTLIVIKLISESKLTSDLPVEIANKLSINAMFYALITKCMCHTPMFVCFLWTIPCYWIIMLCVCVCSSVQFVNDLEN